MKRILVIAPHPDDEVLGCGGVIAKYSKQNRIYLCIVTKAYTPDWSEEFIENRRKEIKKSNRILGIKLTFFLDFPTVKLDTIPQKELNDGFAEVIKETKPDILYIPHKGDLNKDHRLVFESCLVASRPINHRIQKILSYETLSRTIDPFVPNVYEDISETLKDKISAMKAYSSELRKHPHPRSLEMIEILAKKRGSEAGLRLAEAFMLVREVV
ncbi:MAG: PIG-L deacetylase family protein [Patescibacteria group bacterium]